VKHLHGRWPALLARARRDKEHSTMDRPTVREYFQQFKKRHWKGRSADACRGYRNAITRMAAYLQREPELVDFNETCFAEFNRWLQMQFAKATRRSTMGKLRTIWRAAFADGLVDKKPPVICQAPSGVAAYQPNRASVRAIALMTAEEMLALHNPGQPPETVRQLIPRYASERGIRPRTVGTIYYRLTGFETALGRTATLKDLNDTTMNLWTGKMLDAGLSPVTVRGYRGAILALWRAAYEQGYLETRPGRIRKIKCRPAAPKCWTAAELVAVVAAFSDLHGELNQDATIRRSTFWTTFVLVGYYSALRFGDLVSLRWDQIQNGQIVLTMSKTGDVIICPLPPDALQALEKLRGGARKRVFGELMNVKNTQLFFRRVLQAAGLPGSIKWLRRTSATMVECVTPGAAKAHLGHRTHGLAYKHYVDPRQLQHNKPIPPSISQLACA
jgi:integrase